MYCAHARSILWWFNSEWLAYVLIAGFSLVVLGLLYEHYRANPLIMTRWLGAASTLRFIFGAFAIRLLMSEQSYAAVNFLKQWGWVQTNLFHSMWSY